MLGMHTFHKSRSFVFIVANNLLFTIFFCSKFISSFVRFSIPIFFLSFYRVLFSNLFFRSYSPVTIFFFLDFFLHQLGFPPFPLLFFPAFLLEFLILFPVCISLFFPVPFSFVFIQPSFFDI